MAHPIFDLDAEYNRNRVQRDLDIRDAEIETLRQALAEARKVLEFVSTCDLQIMENGYQAEDMAAKFLEEHPA